MDGIGANYQPEYLSHPAERGKQSPIQDPQGPAAEMDRIGASIRAKYLQYLSPPVGGIKQSPMQDPQGPAAEMDGIGANDQPGYLSHPAGRIKQSPMQAPQGSAGMDGIGANYQPEYLPHPAAVRDPYARYSTQKSWLIPRLSLRIDDLSNPGVAIFLKTIKPLEDMREAVIQVLQCLYTVQTQPRNVASVTLILRDFDGVAHSHGSAINNADKEIHFSTKHIQANEARAKQEIKGVLTHEMTHCFQYNAKGTCPGGFIEGVAGAVAPPSYDSVWFSFRLGPIDGLQISDEWDAGYERTAFFLDWVEQQFGVGTIRALNEGMRNTKYGKGRVWRDVTGQSVEHLWETYKVSF